MGGQLTELQHGRIRKVQDFSKLGWCGMVQGLRMVFILEYTLSVTSLLGYQTKHKEVTKTGERKENCAFYKYCMIIETVTETDIQVRLSKRQRLFYSI